MLFGIPVIVVNEGNLARRHAALNQLRAHVVVHGEIEVRCRDCGFDIISLMQKFFQAIDDMRSLLFFVHGVEHFLQSPA